MGELIQDNGRSRNDELNREAENRQENMDKQAMLFDILYALAARDGRQGALFGSCAPLAHEAFVRSVPCDAFPEIWFELPLAGDPWFDLHALTSRESLEGGRAFTADETGGYPDVFAWFSRQAGVRQLALSYDVGRGDIDNPAVQVLVGKNDPNISCSFLRAAERPDAESAYRTFIERIPEQWFACYTGVFPARLHDAIRVECIVGDELQCAYEHDPALLEDHLRQAGLCEFGDTLIPRCQALAGTPFPLEFQFNVMPDGAAGSTLGASVRFASPSSEELGLPFEADGAAGELMERVESWGLADDRWRLFADATFAKRVSKAGESCLLFNFPAFLKLRWHAGESVDAKAYFMAGVQ